MFPIHTCISSACQFDKIATGPIIFFEVFILLGTVVLLLLLSKITQKLLLRYFVVAVGVFAFEFFTAPMWNNLKMGPWAYVYQDISWILTIGWSTLVLSTVLLIDKYLVKKSAIVRFGTYLLSLTFLVFILESIVIHLGIRSYSPEVTNMLSGRLIFGLPVEGLYYISVFMALIISFYKYWSLVIDKELVVPVKKGHWVRNFLLASLGVFLFELMIEPMVTNANLPAWSYIYRDISFLMTGGWVVIIWLVTSFIDKYFIQRNLIEKFLGYLVAAECLTLPIESWLINNGFRVYGPSAAANFSGYIVPIFNVPMEVAFAIPLYLALIIGFIKYWETNLNNRL